MSGRSTRNKLRFQVKRAITRMDEVMFHLNMVDIMAAGRSKHIDETLPAIVEMIDGCKKVLEKFRSSL